LLKHGLLLDLEHPTNDTATIGGRHLPTKTVTVEETTKVATTLSAHRLPAEVTLLNEMGQETWAIDGKHPN
jgi:hypothetical protein